MRALSEHFLVSIICNAVCDSTILRYIKMHIWARDSTDTVCVIAPCEIHTRHIWAIGSTDTVGPIAPFEVHNTHLGQEVQRTPWAGYHNLMCIQVTCGARGSVDSAGLIAPSEIHTRHAYSMHNPHIRVGAHNTKHKQHEPELYKANSISTNNTYTHVYAHATHNPHNVESPRHPSQTNINVRVNQHIT